MENRPLLLRRPGVILHATIFNEEGRAEVGPNLAEQGATASQQIRHLIHRRHERKSTGRITVKVGDPRVLIATSSSCLALTRFNTYSLEWCPSEMDRLLLFTSDRNVWEGFHVER
jgi:hypothetical protein